MEEQASVEELAEKLQNSMDDKLVDKLAAKLVTKMVDRALDVQDSEEIDSDFNTDLDDTTLAKGGGSAPPPSRAPPRAPADEPQVPQWFMNILDQGSVTPQYTGQIRTPKQQRGMREIDFDKGKKEKPNPLDKLLGRVKAEPAAPAVPALGPVPLRASGPMPSTWSQPSAMRARPPL